LAKLAKRNADAVDAPPNVQTIKHSWKPRCGRRGIPAAKSTATVVNRD